jgi:splicing factor U2AF subunit
MMAVGGCSTTGQPVIGCYMNPDKRFAFVEFRNVEEASNAMAFDGVQCQVRCLGSSSSSAPAGPHMT